MQLLKGPSVYAMKTHVKKDNWLMYLRLEE